MSEWIKASERLPEENGMYLTIAYLYWRPIPEFPEELVSADE